MCSFFSLLFCVICSQVCVCFVSFFCPEGLFFFFFFFFFVNRAYSSLSIFALFYVLRDRLIQILMMLLLSHQFHHNPTASLPPSVTCKLTICRPTHNQTQRVAECSSILSINFEGKLFQGSTSLCLYVVLMTSCCKLLGSSITDNRGLYVFLLIMIRPRTTISLFTTVVAVVNLLCL